MVTDNIDLLETVEKLPNKLTGNKSWEDEHRGYRYAIEGAYQVLHTAKHGDTIGDKLVVVNRKFFESYSAQSSNGKEGVRHG